MIQEAETRYNAHTANCRLQGRGEGLEHKGEQRQTLGKNYASCMQLTKRLVLKQGNVEQTQNQVCSFSHQQVTLV